MSGRPSKGRKFAVALALRDRARPRGSAILVAWLLLASFLVAALGHHSPSADGFQTAGQLASIVIGQANFTSHVVSLDPKSLYMPFRPAFDSAGNLWVADENNHRVLEYRPPFTNGEAASLVIGQPNFASNLTTPSQSTIPAPVAIAFDHSGDLWVADFNDNRTLEFVPPFSNGMNASLELGQPAGPNQFTSKVTSAGPAGLHSPVGLAFDHVGSLWIVDRLNNRVLEFKPPFVSGESASLVIGQPDMNSTAPSVTQSGFLQPESVAFDSGGNLWVVDEGNNRALEFTSSSLVSNGPLAALEVGHAPGTDQFSTRGSGTSQNALNAPVGIAFGPSGELVISDRANNRVLGFEPPFSNGMNATFEIGHPPGPGQFTTSDSGLAQDRLHNPLGVAFDSSWNLWVADQVNSRVLEFAATAISTSTTTSPAQQSTSSGSTIPSQVLVSVAVIAVAVALAAAYLARKRRR